MCRLDSWDDASFWSMVSEEKADERRGTEKKYCYIILRTRKLSNTYGFFFLTSSFFYSDTKQSDSDQADQSNCQIWCTPVS